MRVCGVVLAAGAGTRFGSPKQLAALRGAPLLQHAVDVAAGAAVLDRVVVVLGAAADQVEAAIEWGRAERVVCKRWADGLAASLATGIDACAGGDWIVVMLGDQPLLPAAAIERVVGAAGSAPPEVDAVRSRWGGQPGHPVALSRALAAKAASLDGDVGARELLAGVSVLELEMGDLGESPDVDAPADLEALG